MALAAGSARELLGAGGDDGELTERLLRPLGQASGAWKLLFAASVLATGLLLVTIAWTFASGIGAWGNNMPVAWAFAITNFVWWIGIGHAGTFISAFLYLLEQPWRASINRVAEAMTLIAVAIAGLYPLLHLGRPWFFYWLVPYPSTMGVWPQFRSALTWDIAAVLTYATVSLLFWYLGLLPDFATLRDRPGTVARRRVYGVLALGWHGSASSWRRYRVAYGLLAGLATPLVISVHSVVSTDFAITLLPGWHSTIFPPYFVVGALYSGFAMVLMLILPLRWAYGLEDVITSAHLDALAKVLLATGCLIVFSYAAEFFSAWYSGSLYERQFLLLLRPFGPWALSFWLMLACNGLAPQALWFASVRRHPVRLFVVATVVQVGMWLERFVIVVSSLGRDFLPSSWGAYTPTWVDVGLFAGSFGMFGFFFLLFLRFVPFLPIAEIKAMRRELAGAGD